MFKLFTTITTHIKIPFLQKLQNTPNIRCLWDQFEIGLIEERTTTKTKTNKKKENEKIY